MMRKWLARMHVRLLLLVLVTVLPSLAIIVDTHLAQRREAMAASGQLALRSARQVAIRQRDMIGQAHQLLEGLARAPEIRQLDSPDDCTRWLARVAALNELYTDLFAVARDGAARCRSQPFVGNVNVSDRAYFRRAVESREFAIGDFIISRASGKPVVVFAHPVFDDAGEINGVVGLAAEPAAFAALLRETVLPDGSVVTLVDAQGVILARLPDPERIAGSTIPELAQFKAAVAAGKELVVESTWLDGVERATAVAPVKSAHGELFVRVGVPTAVAEAAVLAVVRRNVTLLAVASALVTLFGWLAARYLVLRRIHDLSHTAQRIGAGDLGARCTIPPDEGELGELSRALDDMAEHIERSVTELRAATDEVRLRDRAIDASRNGVLIYRYGPPAAIVSANPALHELVGLDAGQLAATDLDGLGDCGFERDGWEQLVTLLRARREGDVPLSLKRGNGDVRWLEAGVSLVGNDADPIAHAVVELRDVTTKRRFEEQLAHHATHDALTGLPNRNLLGDRLEQALAHAARSGGQLFVLGLDLDRFGVVVDSFGRETSDRALVALGQRIADAAGGCSTVARVAGDKFVLIADHLGGEQAVVSLANGLLEALRRPLVVEGAELRLTASIGVAAGRPDQDADSLLRNVNVATLRAKKMGRDTFCFYDDRMNMYAASRLKLEIELRRAVEREELFLAYQPKVDLITGEISGCEALCRWRHAELGDVSPGEFIPVAEESGLILPIGRWVLESACAQMRRWLDAGVDCRRMAVNVSALQFFRDDLVADVSALLSRHRLAPASLMLEITESTLMGDPERAIATMRRLKALGIRLAIDDFGTGYSSLSTLKRFPIDYLKIDRAFVTDLTTNPSDAAIAVSIISLAHSLNLHVVAEGVETEGQALYLRGRGCDEMQGYFYSRPVAADALATMVAERQWLSFPVQKDLPERTLLLVDDEPSIHSALRRILRREGYNLLFARTAPDALEMLARNVVGVVISDFRMAGMDGVHFLDKVKKLYPASVRVVLSGHADVAAITDAINRGAIFRFLHKPWDDRALLEAVRDAFERYELNVVTRA